MVYVSKFYILVFATFILTSCSNFHHYAGKNKVGSKDGYTQVSNKKAHFNSSTFGDFKFAKSNRQFKKLTNYTPLFRDIVVYAKTQNPDYDYYILLNPEEDFFMEKQYFKKDTIIQSNRLVLLISRKAPESDKDFIFNHLTELID